MKIWQKDHPAKIIHISFYSHSTPARSPATSVNPPLRSTPIPRVTSCITPRPYRLSTSVSGVALGTAPNSPRGIPSIGSPCS